MSVAESRITTVSGGGAFKEETLTKPVPTVFIALGGSGKDVVMRLRKRFFDRFHTRDPGYARFVFVDTDTQSFVPKGENSDAYAELAPHQSELVACPITGAQFHKVFADLNARVNCDHLSWLKLEMERVGAQAVEHGAGTHRQFGRLAFYLNHAAIRHTIERQIADTLQYAADNPTKVEENRIEVMIVMSLAGGTGAGMFIDVAYLVQDILALPNYRTLKGKSVSLICFLPGMFEEQKDLLPRFQQNTFAALMELEYYGTPRTGDELFLGDQRNGSPNDSHWTGFTAHWGDGRKRFIRGPGWDTCFLIDNRNDLDPNSPLPPREVFQMAADYLFLDFENHEFAVAKRSARSNLVQYKDKIKETWVRRPDGPGAATTIYEGNSVYATQNGCRFSSFGVAEIYFDVERLYQVASYRLAGLLVRALWLGAADRHPESQYKTWVKEHLLQPKAAADQEPPPSFHPESLTRRLLTAGSVSRLDDLKRDLDALGQIEPNQGVDQLARVLNVHAGLLREDPRSEREVGAARKTLQENQAKLGGDAITLGPLRKRLFQLAAAHCARHGVASTLRLLDKYRAAFAEIRERARAQAEAAPPSDERLLARLREALRVPAPVHDTAVSIEFTRARAETARALQLRYDKAASSAIDLLLQDLSRYVGDPEQVSYPGLARHGTLYGYYSKAQNFMKAVAERLEDRFKVALNEDRPKVDERAKAIAEEKKQKVARRNSLSPNWDEATYDKRIDEAMVGHPEVKKAEGPIDKFGFDWKKLEALVLQGLRRAAGSELTEARNVDDLIRHWIDNRRTDSEGIVHVSELLATACKAALRGAKDPSGADAGGFHLKEEEDGNAVDLLVRRDDWAEVLEKMVKASMPYFQTTDPSRISNDFAPAYSNLYSQKQGESNASARNAARVFDKVREIVSARGQNSSNQAARALARPLAAGNSTIILVREMTGFPLQFYSHLDTLRSAYESTSTVTRKNDECHINFNEASEDLPDITLLETGTYALIRDNVSFVIRAIILQTINWREGVLKVVVPDPYGPGGIEMRLGTRLHRAIKYACEQERVRKHLARTWDEWQNRATPRDWACLYASGRMTWTQLNPERDVRQGDVSSPLRNCYDNLLNQAMSKLKSTEEGLRWFQALEKDAFVEPPPEGHFDAQANGSTAANLVRTCLRRLNPEVPIYQVIADKVAAVEALA